MYLSDVSQGKGKQIRVPLETSTTRSLPRHFRIGAHVPSGVPSLYDLHRDQLYISKCITVISTQPTVSLPKTFLPKLYK